MLSGKLSSAKILSTTQLELMMIGRFWRKKQQQLLSEELLSANRFRTAKIQTTMTYFDVKQLLSGQLLSAKFFPSAQFLVTMTRFDASQLLSGEYLSLKLLLAAQFQVTTINPLGCMTMVIVVLRGAFVHEAFVSRPISSNDHDPLWRKTTAAQRAFVNSFSSSNNDPLWRKNNNCPGSCDPPLILRSSAHL